MMHRFNNVTQLGLQPRFFLEITERRQKTRRKFLGKYLWKKQTNMLSSTISSLPAA
jgi:hypothetical protein